MIYKDLICQPQFIVTAISLQKMATMLWINSSISYFPDHNADQFFIDSSECFITLSQCSMSQDVISFFAKCLSWENIRHTIPSIGISQSSLALVICTPMNMQSFVQFKCMITRVSQFWRVHFRIPAGLTPHKQCIFTTVALLCMQFKMGHREAWAAAKICYRSECKRMEGQMWFDWPHVNYLSVRMMHFVF